MNEYTGVQAASEAMSTVGEVLSALEHDGYGAYVGLDVHKETIAVSVARPGAGRRRTGVRSATRTRRCRSWWSA